MLRSPMTMSAVAVEQRLDQPRDVAARVLIVGVGVDDEVGAGLERGVDAGHERRGESLAPAEANDVMDAVRARDRRRVVARSVVDDEVSMASMPGTRAADPPASPAASPPRSGRGSG